tara:strand:+ start:115 stop:384 length:270 start_codon:yes stop_codon:yes gene_type:complete
MEKIIFFIIAIPILVFVFYLGGSAIMKGFKAKIENKPEVDPETDKENNNIQDNQNENLSREILRLNELLKSGVLTQEEFDKAKRKILGD